MFTNSQIRYLARESMNSLGRMKVVAMISTLIMSVALMMLALFTLITINLQVVTQTFQSEIEVIAFLRDGVSADDTRQLQEQLYAHPGVESVSYVSKDAAIQEFRTLLGAEGDLVEVLEENPLPASLRVQLDGTARSSEKLELLAAWLRDKANVEEVRYGDLWVQRLERYIHIFLLLDVLVGCIVVASALFVIANTVRLTVLARQRSIDVMRLVGATDWFIRTPFVVEGAIQGGVAAAIAMGVLSAVHRYAARFVGPIMFYDAAQVWGFVALCAVVSALGSLTSLRRFLRI